MVTSPEIKDDITEAKSFHYNLLDLAATWHSETWTMSVDIAKHLTSWVRYKLGQIIGTHLKDDS